MASLKTKRMSLGILQSILDAGESRVQSTREQTHCGHQRDGHQGCNQSAFNGRNAFFGFPENRKIFSFFRLFLPSNVLYEVNY